jgi:transposase
MNTQSAKLLQTARKLGLSVKTLEQYMTTKAAETVTVRPQKAVKASR